MAPLPQITLNFTRQMKLSNDGESLSSNTGEFIFREFDGKVGFSQPLIQYLKLKDERRYFVHSPKALSNDRRVFRR
ncbi:hypothetical protein GCM10011391_15500 [Pullulanibacillus camelliae]|uniref:Transposase DDE domain-containing protein n=1 Tax=Pullulanibacillus camelliae TaxID=1707096 RepID=A0A8J2VPX2_9BACL|nr:hypothetical protein GCM10011391_15500 [Pullulanibacillus camelliae]